MSYTKQEEVLTLHEHMDSPPVFGGVRVAHLVIFLCCVVILCFVCLLPVSCVPNVVSVSGLFFIAPSDFFNLYLLQSRDKRINTKKKQEKQ